MRRGDPERIREAQRAGFVARIASARNIGRERATREVEALEAEMTREGLDPGSAGWSRELERRARLA
jgi:hypothetical protein